MIHRAVVFLFSMACVCGLAFSGCATTQDDGDSDLPWNTPQPWESAPSIPGINNQ